MSTVTVTVSGMSCGHCAQAVRREVGALAGVSAVDVDVPTGAVSIETTAEVDRAAIDDAVRAAGYTTV